MLATGCVGFPSVNLLAKPDGAVIGQLASGVLIEVITDYGDGYPLVLAGTDDSAKIGFIDAHFVTWDTATTGPVLQPPISNPLPTTGGKKYTSDPSELPVVRTKARVDNLVADLRAHWSALNDAGARTMAAQYWFETQGGTSCYDWNFGNRKMGRADKYFMYLRNVWECYDTAGADKVIAAANGLARYATADEIKQHGWKCPDRVVVFSPPHIICKFLAFPSYIDALTGWCAKMGGIATVKPELLQQLNDADTAGLARTLKSEDYYSLSESDYAAGLAAGRKAVDRALTLA